MASILPLAGYVAYGIGTCCLFTITVRLTEPSLFALENVHLFLAICIWAVVDIFAFLLISMSIQNHMRMKENAEDLEKGVCGTECESCEVTGCEKLCECSEKAVFEKGDGDSEKEKRYAIYGLLDDDVCSMIAEKGSGADEEVVHELRCGRGVLKCPICYKTLTGFFEE
ncbi:hypothetical protein K469DRAFT_118611 [Zopfia rhizophila CBS 207.26]|uniref:Uncharacterized protein n=1 Tax=Zopfia rhizophila CBS 207.26 TaxID=1314779 RepID=A0A6A6E4Q1_9PEZI|nr:hypothetical protein K469DRAFT_118611 [Zopfia rhizophila CBS 207.26]